MASATHPIYNKLLTGQRIRKSKIGGRSLEEEAESDRGRVLFCAPFRRLQSKAQVFALETNASVRSRLTHTLEVATVGRQFAQAALNAFTEAEKEQLGLKDKERAFVSFVDAACLIHDLGNPPFGHFGESAISSWFRKHEQRLKPHDISDGAADLWNAHFKDLQHFDGNPQGLRIVTHLQCEETLDFTGLNLTATTIAACLKYPYGSTTLNHERKKPGYFQTEADVVEEVRKILDLEENSRHPLVTLMEAADDTAYCISDIEDGIEKRIVSPDDMSDYVGTRMGKFKDHPIYGEMVPELEPLLDQLRTYGPSVSASGEAKSRKLSPLIDIRFLVLRYVAKYVGQEYKQRHLKILEGNNDPLLPHDPKDPSALIEVFREFAQSKLYFSRLVRQREISAHATFTGLLEAYAPVMADNLQRFQKAMRGENAPDGTSKITIEASLLSQIGDKHKAAYYEAVRLIDPHKSEKSKEVLERIYRIRMVVDFISGMTDDFALRMFQLVSGASTGGGWI